MALTTKAEPEVEARELTVDGQEGVWLPRAMANKVLSDVKLIPKLETKILHLEASILVCSERKDNFRSGLIIAESSRDDAIRALQLSEVQLEEVKERLDSWYRNPFLWVGVGLVVGVAIETSLIFAVK